MNESQFYISDDDRYSRLELIGWWEQSRLRGARVFVAGAGALGNEVLKNLALVGIGHITVIDMDRVENSNLSRSVLFRAADAGRPKAEVAAEEVRRLNPDVEITAIHGNLMTDIGLCLVREMDVVVGCLDNREARLWLNRMCWKVSRPWIDGGIQEINGVCKVFVPPLSACYECGMTEADYRLMQLRYSCPLLRREDLVMGKVPTAPTIASIIAGMQVQEILKLLHGREVDAGSAIVFNGQSNQLYKTRYQFNEECLSHETWEPVEDSPMSCRNTVAEFREWAQKGQSENKGHLVLDRDVVTFFRCGACQTSTKVVRPLGQLTERDSICKTCGLPGVPDLEHRFDGEGPWTDCRLRDLGVPDRDIVIWETAGQIRYIGLSPQ
jgi:molybdopterin/thiamine biosynthesis adenylyltransferase